MPRAPAFLMLTSAISLVCGIQNASASVYGFGNDEPLSIAVKAIVPHNDRVTYAKDVDRHIRVSWRGGQSWQAVLQSALRPAHLVYVHTGDRIHIFNIPGTSQSANDVQGTSSVTSAVQSPGLSIASMVIEHPAPAARPAVQDTSLDSSGLEILATQKPVHAAVDHIPARAKPENAARKPAKKSVVRNDHARQRTAVPKPVDAPSTKATITAARLPSPAHMSPAAPVKPVKIEQTWVLPIGSSLKTDMEKWGHRAGYKIYWEIKNGSGQGQTLIIPQTIRIHGSFKKAVGIVTHAMQASNVDFHVRYNNFSGADSATISGIWSTRE